MENKQYTEQELQQLHAVLYDILAEIDRVCRENNIRYFIIGGTAIGAHFFDGIIPWDDDIDIGMTAGDYERFMAVAPAALRTGYTLCWPGNEPHTPFYFAKVRKDGTRFVEEVTEGLDMHHGIYVDIFPMNRVPQSKRKERWQRKTAKYLNLAFICKDAWMLKHCGTPKTSKPYNWNWMLCFLFRLLLSCVSKKAIYNMLWRTLTRYDHGNGEYYNVIIMPQDHIAVTAIDSLDMRRFGQMDVYAPSDLETYLRHHYGNITKYPPEEKRINHRPMVLQF